MDLQQIKQRFQLVGNDAKFNRALEIALQIAPTEVAVLVQGESGTGKEVIPKIIHQLSPRKHGGYIAVNCGAIPEGTIDSELFGHEKGAFTGATEQRKGYFAAADEGTIFLDEIAELPLKTQVRLLRVLETGEFLKVGSSKVEKTNVRVVAASHKNLQDQIQKGLFREDLYYRLNTVKIQLPPLRERGEDIHLLFKKFAFDFAKKYNIPVLELEEKAVSILLEYPFYGNIRQLRNLVEQMSILEINRNLNPERLLHYLPYENPSIMPVVIRENPNEYLINTEMETLYKKLEELSKNQEKIKNDLSDIKQFLFQFQQQNQTKTSPILELPVQDLSLDTGEKELIIRALKKYKGKRKYAADELGISERTLYRKIKDFEIDEKE